MSDAASPEPEPLLRAFRALPPRSAQLLARRHLQGQSLDACAAHYGISIAACAVHLARATDELAARLGASSSETGAPDSFAQEERAALTLEAALDAASPVRSGDPRVALLRELRARGPALAAALREAELAEERSAVREREDLLRRVAIAILIALALYFAWRRNA